MTSVPDPEQGRAGVTPTPTPTRNPRSWPAGLLGMLVLVAGVERAVSRNDLKFTNVATSAWTLGAVQLPNAARSAVVCFGDSLVKDGVIPGVLQERHGLSAWNLALPKGTAPAHYVLLDRLLRRGARPEAVLVDGELLCDNPLAETRVWPELAGPAELAGLAAAGRDPAFLGRSLLARWLVTFRARPDIRVSVVAALAGQPSVGQGMLAPAWRNWNTNRGAYVLDDRDETPGADPRLPELAVAGHLSAGWRCNPVNDAYVRRFLDLAEAHGVPVFWLLPPPYPELQARRERYGWDSSYMTYVRRLQHHYPRLTVVDARHSGYPAAAFFDILHLSRTGGIFYTDSLGSMIRDRLGPAGLSAPRWVELPRYSAPVAARLAASAPSVEDVSASELALRTLWSGGETVRR